MGLGCTLGPPALFCRGSRGTGSIGAAGVVSDLEV